ncbi:MAG: sigma factor-like helix-turn-helix DNA-binding protein [Sphingomonadaceae bacterium]
MSKTTIALEAAVAAVIENTPKDGAASARQRATVDKAFHAILKLIAPRIRHFIRQYGLVSHWEDAEQCCAIAVHRAISGYDPAKAQFTTFVNWQIRGELQSLRFRVMTDQRPSAKKVEATTVSLHALTAGGEGEESTLETMLEDSGALARTEAGASDYLARAATRSLVKEYVDQQRSLAIAQLQKRPRPKRGLRAEHIAGSDVAPQRPRGHGICPAELEKLEAKLARDREIVERRVFDDSALDEVGTETGVTKERVRQITKRAARTLAELAASHPRFAMMADYRRPHTPASRGRAPALVIPDAPILPPIGQLHNTLSRLVAIDARATRGLCKSPAEDVGEPEAFDPILVTAELPDGCGNALGSVARH